MWDDIIKRFQGFSIKSPQNAERFQSTIDAVKAIKEATTKLEKAYADLVAQKYNLLVSGLEIAFEATISKEQLLKFEIKDIESILNNGNEQQELAIENWSELLSFNQKSISQLYRKLIKGQESFLLFKFMDDEKSYDELSTTRALVMYRDYLEGLLNEIQTLPPPNTVKEKLKVPQIALIHVYEGIQITRDNAKDIAAKYGYTAKTSGEGLYQDYVGYLNANDRRAKPDAETKKTLLNKISRFESVLKHLSPKARKQASDEINILKIILESEYP